MCIVSEILQSLRIADAVTVGEILHSKGLYSTPHSARVNAQKKLNALVALGQLERGSGFYRTPGCRSEYREHAQLLTQTLAEVLKLPFHSAVFREHTTPINLRPDALVLLKRENQGLCLVLEIINHETEQYYRQKVDAWNNWEGAAGFLSKLFGYRIPHYEIVPVPDIDEFKKYLKEAI